MNINAEWHAHNKMPKNPTLDQRVRWHLAHARHCGCRPLHGEVLEEIKKRYVGTHQEFWVFFTRRDHTALAEWAAACAERVLPFFEVKHPQDARPHHAIETLYDWINTGQFRMAAIRSASLASHAAAREVAPQDPAACYTARAAGQAVATAHVPTHALGAALYAIKAIAATQPANLMDVVAQEHTWQLQNIPANLRDWVEAGLRQNQHLLSKDLREIFS